MTDWDNILEGIKLRQEEDEERENYFAEVKFFFNLIFKGEQCEDDYLQEFCRKIMKKIYELPEIQEKYPNFDDFDELFQMSVVDCGEVLEIDGEDYYYSEDL